MITITHTHEGGTLIEGSRKGDGVFEILKGLYGNWRYFPSLRQIGIGQSRDKAADMFKINRAAEALRNAGHEVTVEVDDTITRSFAEAEAERYERAGDRAAYHDQAAGKAASASDAAWRAEHAILDVIPAGQPILVGHHSERRHRRDLERAESARRRGMAEAERSEYHADRAEAAEHYQARRESVPTTLRRIEKLEAEERLIQRRLDGTDQFMNYGKPATGEWRERLLVRAEEIAGELEYWREHVAKRQESGVKVWSKADFTKGDFVQFIGGWYEVLRVNAKSVTIPAMISDGPVVTKANSRLSWTDTVPYHKIKGRKSAEEMAGILAAAEAKSA